jgi:hypothetical protein
LNQLWWAILGIAPTDDVRSVKRAYAARLKACRPEDDPQGFAQLREAYEAVLARLASTAKAPAVQSGGPSPKVSTEQPSPSPVANPQAAYAEAGQHSEKPPIAVKPVVSPPHIVNAPPASVVRPLAAPSPAPHAPLPPPVARVAPLAHATVVNRSPHEVAGDILEEARRRDGRWSGFMVWLHERDDLISLQFKSATSEALLRRIATEGAPHRDAVDAMALFFGWDDYRRAGQSAAAKTLAAQAKQRVAEDECAKWLDAAYKRRDATARTLKLVERLGDGKRAWLMASLLINRSRVVKAFRVVASKYGEAVLPAVLGEKAVKFWYRALAPLPNLLQLALTIPAGIVTVGLIAVLWRVDSDDRFMLLPLLLWTVLLTAGAFLGLDFLGLGIRQWNGRCLPYIQRQWRALTQVLHIQKVPNQVWGATALALLGAAGWWWPASVPDWPFYTFVLLISWGAFKERRTLYGCALATVGASVLFRLFVDNGKPPFVVLPLTLWVARTLHEPWLRMFPRMKARQETVVLFVGAGIGLVCLVMAGWHIS